MNIFVQIEQSALGMWLRTSPWGYQASLIVHSIALAFVAGINFAIGLRLVGAVPRIPLDGLFRLLPLMWVCFFLSLVTGVLLICTYPAKVLTNELFYIKLSLIAVGLVLTRTIVRRHRRSTDIEIFRRRLQGMVLLLVWAAVIISGRLLAYTYDVLSVNELYY